jgi:hypothetical protein
MPPDGLRETAELGNMINQRFIYVSKERLYGADTRRKEQDAT